MICKSRLSDLTELVVVLQKAIADMGKKGIYQWDEIYPNEETILSDSIYIKPKIELQAILY